MSMFHDWGSFNKHTSKGLQKYFKLSNTGETIRISGLLNYWMAYERTVTKSYSFVGMDEATARKCADAMVAKYTYTWNCSEGGLYEEDREITKQGASVSVAHDDADLWSVNVEVNQVDTFYCLSSGNFLNPPQMLITEAQAYFPDLGYDEDEAKGAWIRVTNQSITKDATYYKHQFFYDYSVGDWTTTTENFMLQSSADGVTWTNETPYLKVAKQKRIITKRGLVADGFAAFKASLPKYYRLIHPTLGTFSISLATSALTDGGTNTDTITAEPAFYEGGAWKVRFTEAIDGFQFNGGSYGITQNIDVQCSSDNGVTWTYCGMSTVWESGRTYVATTTKMGEDLAGYKFRIKYIYRNSEGGAAYIYSAAVGMLSKPQDGEGGTDDLFVLTSSFTSSAFAVSYRTTIETFDATSSTLKLQYWDDDSAAWTNFAGTQTRTNTTAKRGTVSAALTSDEYEALTNGGLRVRLVYGTDITNTSATFYAPANLLTGVPYVSQFAVAASSVTLGTVRVGLDTGGIFTPTPQYSTDGGTTWTDCTSYTRTSDKSTCTITDANCDEYHSRAYRLIDKTNTDADGNAYVTAPVTLPMQGTFVAPYNPGSEEGTGDLFITCGGGQDMGASGFTFTAYYDASAISDFDYTSTDFDLEYCPADAESANEWTVFENVSERRSSYISGTDSSITTATSSLPWVRIKYGDHTSAPVRFPLSANATGLRVTNIRPNAEYTSVKFTTDITDFEIADARGEYSTDGETWTECETYTTSESSGVYTFNFKDATTSEETALYYRIKYGSTYSPAVKFPLQGTLAAS